jgi:hypothetical protein
MMNGIKYVVPALAAILVISCKLRVPKPYKSEIDSLTGKKVAIQVNTGPLNEGGFNALSEKLESISRTLDSLPACDDGKVAVAFIVEENGHISGERIVKDCNGRFGKAMLAVALSFKWQPATWDGDPVPMVRTVSLQRRWSE